MAIQSQHVHMLMYAIVLTVKVLEVGQLDALPHAQDVGSSAEAVEHHPEIASVQR